MKGLWHAAECLPSPSRFPPPSPCPSRWVSAGSTETHPLAALGILARCLFTAPCCGSNTKKRVLAPRVWPERGGRERGGGRGAVKSGDSKSSEEVDGAGVLAGVEGAAQHRVPPPRQPLLRDELEPRRQQDVPPLLLREQPRQLLLRHVPDL